MSTTTRARAVIVAVTTAIVASLFTVSVAAAWHVDQSCGTIEYDGYEYRIAGGDWTTSDTRVRAGTYTIEFRNGETQRVTISTEGCSEPRTIDIRVRGMVCGDPRIFAKAVNRGEVVIPVRLRFKFGSKKFDDIRYANMTTGGTKKIGPRWARGTFWIEAYDGGQWNRIITRTIGKNIQPRRWSEKGCPSGLLAGKDKVDFRKAQFVGRYVSSVQ